ncbi:hypothetical protein Trydic_g23836 [Trypoxylus dichotomus]
MPIFHQAGNDKAPHTAGDVDIPPNSDSANSEIPIMDGEDNKVGNTENNEELETNKENNETGISNVPNTSTVQAAPARSEQFATIFIPPDQIRNRKELQK